MFPSPKKSLASLVIAFLLLTLAGSGAGASQLAGQATPDPSDDELARVATTFKEPQGPPAIDRAAAVNIANNWLKQLFGATDGGSIAASAPGARYILFSQAPNIMDKPTWVVKYTQVAALEGKFPCGFIVLDPPGGRIRCTETALYVLVDPVHQEAFEFVALGRSEDYVP
ncbi:MAG: hypothetical protein Q8P50_04445 [Bacillota bacterium]|nr:hypothetical protein [Bacillota bacterium]